MGAVARLAALVALGVSSLVVSAPADAGTQGHDRHAPVVRELRISRTHVDVTKRSAVVRVRVHVTDDTGVAGVQLFLTRPEVGGSLVDIVPTRVRGTARNGWWAARVRVPRWGEPGSYGVEVSATDRVNRMTDVVPPPRLQVVDRNPDRTAPVVVSLARPGLRTTVDVRRGRKTIRVRAHLADRVSGLASVLFCPERPLLGGYSNLACVDGRRVRGTVRDGWWVGQVVIPRRSAGGDWNLGVWLTDRAHSQGEVHYWMGPDHYRVATAGGTVDPRDHLIPGGKGRITVIGVHDSHAPVVAGLVVRPATVDTGSGPATVRVDLRAKDVEGVREVGAELVRGNGSEAGYFVVGRFSLVSGTRRDGVWRGTLQLPQGTPPGVLYVSAWVEDVSHFRNFESSGLGHGDADAGVMSWNPRLTVTS